jgi:hypothetical protein
MAETIFISQRNLEVDIEFQLHTRQLLLEFPQFAVGQWNSTLQQPHPTKSSTYTLW